MHWLPLWTLVLITSLVNAQHLFKSEEGQVKFFSDAPLEDIVATTTKAKVVMNDSTGDVAVLIPIKSFMFRKALMQEHFNENYLESDRYKDATFKGKLSEQLTLKSGEQKNMDVSGQLVIHGVSKQRTIEVNLKKNRDGSISVSGKFNVKVAEHGVSIPSLLFQNIAEVVEVTLDFNLKPIK